MRALSTLDDNFIQKLQTIYCVWKENICTVDGQIDTEEKDI